MPEKGEPQQIELVGAVVAIRWSDGLETYFPMEALRRYSPSAENIGEADLMGNRMGGAPAGQDFSGVLVTGWSPVGGYGIQFQFSDGHRTGIFSYSYLRALWAELEDTGEV